MEEWVKECQRLKINLRGKEGEEAIARTTGLPIERQATAHIPFTQDNFLDGLVQFIVATDQVFFFEALHNMSQHIQVILNYILLLEG